MLTRLTRQANDKTETHAKHSGIVVTCAEGQHPVRPHVTQRPGWFYADDCKLNWLVLNPQPIAHLLVI